MVLYYPYDLIWYLIRRYISHFVGDALCKWVSKSLATGDYEIYFTCVNTTDSYKQNVAWFRVGYADINAVAWKITSKECGGMANAVKW